jgi:ankyrin repeat protein
MLHEDLAEAAMFGDYPRVIRALDSGLPVNSRAADGTTLLMFACENWSSIDDVIRILIERGADVNLSDDNGETALMTACRSESGTLTSISILMDAGADVNQRDARGRTALFYCGVAELNQLVAHGADVNAADYSGDTPLLSTAQGYSPGLIEQFARVLIEAGADVHAVNHRQQNALMLLAQNRHPETDRTDLSSDEIEAINNSRIQTCRLLINAGVDVNRRDASGKTALDLARGTANNAIVRVLTEG